MQKNNLYNKTYFENGVEAGISGYQNYRWLPEQTILMCSAIAKHVNILKSDTILDYGCAKGFLVKGFTELGYNCSGVDISEYAIENSDVSIKEKLKLLKAECINQEISAMKKDVIICKDVLEHVPYENINDLIKSFYACSSKLFVVVPLAENGRYIIPDYEKDLTHIIREKEQWWKKVFESAGYNVNFTFKVSGIKDNWSHYQKGNGFFLCTK